MADFCWQCTIELTGEQQYARLNDFVSFDRQWGTCEGCGTHRFDDAGQRLCVPLRHVEPEHFICQQCAETEP